MSKCWALALTIRGRPSGLRLPVWVDGKARVLIDMGPGSALNFEESGADFKDLIAVVFSQLHVGHSADLPAFLHGAAVLRRKEDLPIFGPSDGEKTSDSKPGLVGSSGPTVLPPPRRFLLTLLPRRLRGARRSRQRGRKPGGAFAAWHCPFCHRQITTRARASPGAWTWARSALPLPGIRETGAKR